MHPTSQAESIMQEIYRNAMREADTARKNETARMLAYFNDTQVPYILEQLAQKHASPERYHPAFLNIVKKVVKNLSMVYLQDAVRVADGSPEDKAIYAAIETTAQLSAKMKMANRYSKLLGTIMLRPVWRKGVMDLDVVTGDVLDVTTGATPEDLQAVLVTFDQSGRSSDVEYDLWTAKEYQRLDYRGNVLESQPNPYGVAPFVPVFSHAPTDTFWLPGAADLVTIQDAINQRLSALLFTADLQGFGIPYTKGAVSKGGQSTPELKFGPGDYIGLPEGADFGFASPNAPLPDMLAIIDFLIKQAAVTNGLSASAVSTTPTQESGVSKVVGNAELEEQRRDDIALFAGYEQRLFGMFRIIWNVHNPERQMSEASTLRVDFYDPKPVLSGYEQAKEWDLLLDRQLISPVDIMIERNPDLTREEAKARLREIQAEIQEFSGGEDDKDFDPSFNNFRGIPGDYNNSANPA